MSMEQMGLFDVAGENYKAFRERALLGMPERVDQGQMRMW